MEENTAQEMAMHIALCVCAEYIQSWGLAEFLEKLTALGGQIQGQMFPIDVEDEKLQSIRDSWNSVMHQHFVGKKNPGSLEVPGLSSTR